MEDVPQGADAAAALARELTVCICTRDRPEALERALCSVGDYAPGASVVVSDDGSPAQTRRVVSRFSRCVWQMGPRRGLGANRNSAVQPVRSPWVLFLDDDARVGEGFLPAMAARMAEVGIDAESNTVLTGRELKNGHVVVPRDVDFLGFQRREYSPDDDLHTVVINATLWPRSLFDRVRFDEELRYGSDEVDLSYTALTAGYRIERSYKAVNHHDPDLGGRDTYALDAQLSRLRVTKRRYFRLQHLRLRGVAFVVVAPVHLVLAMVKREGVRGPKSAWWILRRWALAGSARQAEDLRPE